MILVPLGLSTVFSLILIPLVRRLCFKTGKVVAPREDRWHRKSTPTLGGIGIFLAFLGALFASHYLLQEAGPLRWGLLAGAGLVFFLGIVDDIRPITPPTKLVGQMLAAALVVFFGYTTAFFTPRISNNIVAQIPNILLTIFWLIGITNAINLLDNMDGLAGGISLISAGFLSYFFWQSGDTSLLLVSLSLFGSILGFLIFNFPPASIFMGDSGSLFLGFTLAVLAIARKPQASNVFAVLGAPTLLFLLPILDTTLVTITRLLRGQSPARGGRDHTSHRLIAFGLTERQAVWALYGVAFVSGVAGIAIETLDYLLSLVLVPILVLSLALLAAYLGRLKVVASGPVQSGSAITRLMVELTYRRRVFEILFDLFLIGIAYYLAFWMRFGLSMSSQGLVLFLQSLPLALAGTYISFFISGVYRGVWKYVGVDDLVIFIKATLGSVLLTSVAVLFLFPTAGYTPTLFLLFAVLLLLGLATTRSSFKLLDIISGQQSRNEGERVLIIGAGDAGEMAARWIMMNPDFGYQAVGFADDDPFKLGRKIHGVEIIGGLSNLDEIIEKQGIDGVVVTLDAQGNEEFLENIVAQCRDKACWVRTMRLDFELVE
jgi:UDP-GlcNAc:undecaprenyl-phosphate GlcNAc-1-phosphate transferase